MRPHQVAGAALIKFAVMSDELDALGRNLQTSAAGIRGNDYVDAAMSATLPALGGAFLGGGIGAAKAERGKRLRGALKGALLGGLLTGVPTGIYGLGKNHGATSGIFSAGQLLRDQAEKV